MGAGWKADLKKLTDLVESLDRTYHLSVHNKQATRSAQAGEQRHKWWLFGVDTGYTNVSPEVKQRIYSELTVCRSQIAAPTKSYFDHEKAAKEVRDSVALRNVRSVLCL